MLLLPENARLIGQGITGSEGSRAAQWALDYGTNIVAGVTPGKGGQDVNSIPIFNSIKEAVAAVGQVDGTVSFVPPLMAKSAFEETVEAGIKFSLVIAEKVPTKDEALMYALANKGGVSLIGPNSVGLICPSRKLKIGLIGGGEANKVFVPGNISIVSKSGSMTAEISLLLKNAGWGVSWAVGIGGDRIIGTDYVDFLTELEKDTNTKAAIIFGELGGTYEEKVAEAVKVGKIKKPVVAYIGGEFAQMLPSEVQFGHAGAIIEGERGKPDYKRQVLAQAGVRVARNFDEIAELVR